MSHFTKVNTKIKDLNMLKQALKELNMQFIEADQDTQLKIKGWNKDETEVLMEIKTVGPYSVGVVLNKETQSYDFVADWWGVETYNEQTQDEFLNKITQKYAYSTVLDKIRSKGYDVVTDEVDDQENIHVVLRKWQ